MKRFVLVVALGAGLFWFGGLAAVAYQYGNPALAAASLLASLTCGVAIYERIES